MDVWGDLRRLDDDTATADRVAHLAALCAQLPRESRMVRTLAPAGSHSDELLMLRRMELNQRRWHWANTKAAEGGKDEPQPVLLEGEAEAHEAAVEEQRRAAGDVAAAFGISPEGISIYRG